MKIGSLVEVLVDFYELRIIWNIRYPLKGEILTISSIIPHPVKYMNLLRIKLLYFEEHPELVGLCDRTFYGKYNFKEIQQPLIVSLDNGVELIEQ